MTISDVTSDSKGINKNYDNGINPMDRSNGSRGRHRAAITSIGSAIPTSIQLGENSSRRHGTIMSNTPSKNKTNNSVRGSDSSKIGSTGGAPGEQSIDGTVRSVRVSTIATREARESVVEAKATPLKFAEMKNLFQDMLRGDDGLVEVTTAQIERIRKTYLGFSEGAEFSFNYNVLLMVASILAGLGLAQGSVTTIIASMLVSPIMGPVMGIAYGGYIHDFKLKKKAFITETVSLLVCVVFGVIIGCCTGWTELGNTWPNPEMYNRGTWQNLLVGLPIAFFSGLGVAVSLLDEQTSSLVGVAISASLLPPAVNAGLLAVAWGFYKGHVENGQEVVVPGGNYEVWDPSDDEMNWARQQFMHGAGISLLLTVVNIILIIIASSLMFRLKERLPIRKKIYWMDLAAARAINKNLAMQFDDEEFDAANLNDAIHAANSGDDSNDGSPPRHNRFSVGSSAPMDVVMEGDESTGKGAEEWGIDGGNAPTSPNSHSDGSNAGP